MVKWLNNNPLTLIRTEHSFTLNLSACIDYSKYNRYLLVTELPHQVASPRDHTGAVDGQPGFVPVEVAVGSVEHVEAEDRQNPAGRDGSEHVAVETQQ